MPSYIIYGWKIDIDMDMPMLVPFEKRTDFSVKEEDIPVINVHKGIITEDLLTKYGEKNFAQGEDECWLQNNTCYIVAKNGNEIIYQLKDGELCHPEWLGTYLLGWGMSMIGLVRGETAIHCSAVCGPKGAILICGESGSGKSTLTASFLKEGYRLMADDMAMASVDKEGKMVIKPAFPFQKLVRDAALKKGYDVSKLIYINEEKDKFLVPYEGTFLTEDEPVLGIIMVRKYYLSSDDEADAGKIKELSQVYVDEPKGFSKLVICSDNLFLRFLLKEDRLKGDVGRKVMEMAERIPLYCIMRPDGYDTSKEVTDKAFELVERLSSEAKG